MFVPVTISVKNSINPTDVNNLTLIFDSPVNYAKSQYEVYKNQTKHDIPESCPSFGECYVNFIRKTQSSFSWDWGPTFATVGVADSVYLEYFNKSTIYEVYPLITYDKVRAWHNIKIG